MATRTDQTASTAPLSSVQETDASNTNTSKLSAAQTSTRHLETSQGDSSLSVYTQWHDQPIASSATRCRPAQLALKLRPSCFDPGSTSATYPLR